MKIKDIKFPAGLGCVQEFCNGRLIATHEIWDLTPENNTIYFSCDGVNGETTYINIDSEVTIIDGGIQTIDTHGNKIELRFYRWAPANIE